MITTLRQWFGRMFAAAAPAPAPPRYEYLGVHNNRGTIDTNNASLGRAGPRDHLPPIEERGAPVAGVMRVPSLEFKLNTKRSSVATAQGGQRAVPTFFAKNPRSPIPATHLKGLAMNQLHKVEPHAVALEDAADRMDAAGIAGHPTRGHAVVLRTMATAMRADASQHKVPYIYQRDLSAAATADDDLSSVRAQARPEDEARLRDARMAAQGELMPAVLLSRRCRVSPNDALRKLATRSVEH